MAMRANALAVMAKAPLAGQVKTRLMPMLTAEEAAELARALLTDQLNNLSGLGKVDFYLAFTPEDSRGIIEKLAPAAFRLFPQEGDDLGARMKNIFDMLFAKGHKNNLLIGSDLPPIPVQYFREAYEFLQEPGERAVLGPARDGGYYLVGCNGKLPEIFSGMTWSHSEVLSQTLSKLAAREVVYFLLPTWFDIDTPDDLRYLKSTIDASLEQAMTNSLNFLRRLKVI